MRRWFLSATACALLLGLQGSAQASFISYDYSGIRGQVSVAAGTGGIGFTNEGPHSATGSSHVIVTTLTGFSSTTTGAVDTYTDVGYSVKLHVTDTDSGLSHDFSFSGLLNGTYSNTSSNLTNTFDSPTTLSAQIGDHVYSVTIGPFQSPGPGNSFAPGSIGADIDVRDAQVKDAPEPSTLCLSGLGLSSLWLMGWRRRKAKK